MLRAFKPPSIDVSGALSSVFNRPLTPRTPNGASAELGGLQDSLLPPVTPVERTNGNVHPARREEDDALLDDDFPLPFSAAAAAYKDAYASPDVASVAAFAPSAHQLIFSPGRSTSNRDSIISSASIETKDDFLLELLSGQALVEAQDFEILPWETVDQLKNEHKEVVEQISLMTNQLASETRMRDAAASLKKQDGARSLLRHPGLERTPSSASIDERVGSAAARIESLSTELYALKHREISIRTRLLRHIAAVLAATVRRRDSLSNASSKRSSVLLKRPGGANRLSQNLSSPLRGAAGPFDGAHFFANNRAAVPPLPRGSPKLDPAVHTALQAEIAEKAAECDRLQEEISRLRASLASAQTVAETNERQLKTSRSDAEVQRSALEQTAKRAELRAQSERAALLAALSRHRSSISPLASCVPILATTDDAAAAFDAFFQQATAHVQSQSSSRDSQAAELAGFRAELDRQNKRAADAEAATHRAEGALKDVWDILPAASSVDAGTAAPSLLMSVFSSASLPGRRGLGIGSDDAGFSHEALLDRAKLSAGNARSLANRVAKEQGDSSALRTERDRLQSALREAQDSDDKARSQLRDLEGRAAAAASQEVASLERLNELQAGFETTRLEKSRAERERDNHAERARKAESDRGQLSTQVEDLQRQLQAASTLADPLKAANQKLEQELEDVRQQLVDAQDDLDEMKSRESKQRVVLLDELNTAQTEISSLRSQLRAEQRRKAPIS